MIPEWLMPSGEAGKSPIMNSAMGKHDTNGDRLRPQDIIAKLRLSTKQMGSLHPNVPGLDQHLLIS